MSHPNPAPRSSRVVAVPDLDGDFLGALQLLHQVLELLAAWEADDPAAAQDPQWALPKPLASGAAAAAVTRLCQATDTALSAAAQPFTPTGHRLDPIGWAQLASGDLAALDLAAQVLPLALLPHGCPMAAEALAAVARDDGHRPEAIVGTSGRLLRVFTATSGSTLTVLAPRLPAVASHITLDRAGHIAYNRYASAIHDIWFDDLAPYTTLQLHQAPPTTGSPCAARPPRATHGTGDGPR